MAHTTIETLKTMLAHLDDAKKYQSLRDVLQSLPAPDLAPVFEDLSPEKRPVLFRLCPKDQAAALFAELTPETQQSLIEELSDKELGAVVAALCADDAADLVDVRDFLTLLVDVVEDFQHARFVGRFRFVGISGQLIKELRVVGLCFFEAFRRFGGGLIDGSLADEAAFDGHIVS